METHWIPGRWIVLTWLVVFGGWVSAAPAHVLPDGTIHRNLQVVATPDGLMLEFEVGMNDATLRAVGQRLVPDADWDLEGSELTRQFTDLMAVRLKDQFSVQINGKTQPLRLANQELSPKHHQIARFEFEVPVDWSQRTEIEIADQNWLDAPGQARVALKGKRIKIADSNAALLIVRAEPIEMDELTPDERAEMLTIRGVVVP